MPHSDYHPITDVLHVIEQTRAKSILDVGIGFGRWGVLCREIFDVYEGRFRQQEWATRIDGIEAFEDYRNPIWQAVYDRVFVGNAFDLIDKLGMYDLIIAGDVIEHFEKERGREFLKKMLDHGKFVVITSPKGYCAQAGIFGNNFEEHRSGWTTKDFAGTPNICKDCGFDFMAVLSSNKELLRPLRVRRPLETLGIKNSLRELLRLICKRILKNYA